MSQSPGEGLAEPAAVAAPPDLESLADALAQPSAGEENGAPTGDSRPPADRKAVVGVIERLRELLFPRHFRSGDGDGDGDGHGLRGRVGRLLGEIDAALTAQVADALRFDSARRGRPSAEGDVAARSREIVRDFLAQVPRLRALLATDLQAAFDGDPAAAGPDEITLAYPGFLAILIHRLAHELHVRRVPLIPRVMSEHAHSVTGIDIHPGAEIGERFFIDHGTGVVIGETTVIGRRVKIYQSVTLGALSTRGGQKLRGVKRHPTIEDDVTIYSGASILGGETVVGAGAVIASNVFITQSVPPRTRVTVKNPELQYRDDKPREFKQGFPDDWVI
jgi:serine O-acetyltransferase